MEVVNARSSLLANYEVLALLKELQSDQIARTKTALRIKKEEEHSSDVNVGKHLSSAQEETLSENVRTVQFETIQYLSAEYQPNLAQDEASIIHLVKDLLAFDLTKGEKLQIVNLAPTETVELYVVLEELEDRLGDKMEDVLTIVRKSLINKPQATNGISDGDAAGNLVIVEDDLTYPLGDEEPLDGLASDQDAIGDEFLDVGEGAGVEGELEMEDD